MRHRRSRLPYYLRRLWREVKRRTAPTPKPQRDLEAEAIAKADALVARLEIAAAIGSVSASGQLADMAEDRVGLARRQLARDALDRLQANPFPTIRTI